MGMTKAQREALAKAEAKIAKAKNKKQYNKQVAAAQAVQDEIQKACGHTSVTSEIQNGKLIRWCANPDCGVRL